jgi:hypothetical protein
MITGRRPVADPDAACSRPMAVAAVALILRA